MVSVCTASEHIPRSKKCWSKKPYQVQFLSVHIYREYPAKRNLNLSSSSSSAISRTLKGLVVLSVFRWILRQGSEMVFILLNSTYGGRVGCRRSPAGTWQPVRSIKVVARIAIHETVFVNPNGVFLRKGRQYDGVNLFKL